MIWIIPDPSSKQKIMLLSASVSLVPFAGWTRFVKISGWVQHSSNCIVPGFFSVFATFWGICDKPHKTVRALFRNPAHMLLNSTSGENWGPGMLIAWIIWKVSLIRFVEDWHNHCPGRKLILCILPPIGYIWFAGYSITVLVSEQHRFTIVVFLKWGSCQQELDTFKCIPEEWYSVQMWILFHPIVITELKSEARVEFV